MTIYDVAYTISDGLGGNFGLCGIHVTSDASGDDLRQAAHEAIVQHETAHAPNARYVRALAHARTVQIRSIEPCEGHEEEEDEDEDYI